MEKDPFYHRCCLTGRGIKTENRFNMERIEWHHNLIYAGKQVQEKWAILPIVKRLHDQMVGETKERCDWIMLNRATEEDLARFDRANLKAKRDALNKKYGPWPT